MHVRIDERASMLYRRRLSHGKPGSWYPSRHEWVYLLALEQIQGRELPLLTDIEGGVTDHVYVLAATTYRNQPNVSSVMAIPEEFVVARMDSGPVPATPLDLSRGTGAWWVKEGLEVVRLLTSWVDGFSAFKRVRVGSTCEPQEIANRLIDPAKLEELTRRLEQDEIVD